MGLRLAAHPGACGRGPGLGEGETAGAALSRLAAVVDVAGGDRGEALEPHVAVDVEHAAQDHFPGGSGELAEGLVGLGQQGHVAGGECGAGTRWPEVCRDDPGCRRFCGVSGRAVPWSREKPVTFSMNRFTSPLSGFQSQYSKRTGARRRRRRCGRHPRTRPAHCPTGSPESGRGCESVRCDASRSSSDDLFAPPFSLISRWKPAPRSGSLAVELDALDWSVSPLGYPISLRRTWFPTEISK